jgi:hypothetical protein
MVQKTPIRGGGGAAAHMNAIAHGCFWKWYASSYLYMQTIISFILQKNKTQLHCKKSLAIFTVCFYRYYNTMKPVNQSKTTVKKNIQYAMSSTCFLGCCGQCECCCCVDPAHINK